MTNERTPGRIGYGTVKFISRILAPAFHAAFYIAFVLAALCIVCAFVVLLVNTPVEEFLLPPFMRTVETKGEITGYHIFIGNGVKIYAESSNVTLADIKYVIYAGLSLCFMCFLVLAPIFQYLSNDICLLSAITAEYDKNDYCFFSNTGSSAFLPLFSAAALSSRNVCAAYPYINPKSRMNSPRIKPNQSTPSEK